MSLENKEIILGVTGGIACYKSLDLIRRLKDHGANISVVLTKSAMEFVTALPFQTLSNRPVTTSLFDDLEGEISHIQLAEKSDLLLIAPATANIIGKAAAGIADDYLSTLLLANKSPLYLAPAMNTNMWKNSIVQENLKKLLQYGATIIPPASGLLACGSYGMGKLADVESIVNVIKGAFNDLPLKGVSVLITAGPTWEKIDAVRYIANYSSGKMGFALASSCQKLGAKVCLISGPTALDTPPGVERINVVSTEEMYKAVTTKAKEAELIIKAAAVGDYKVQNTSPSKIKKSENWPLELTKNPDILQELGKNKKKHQFIVGFAAESDNLEKYAKTKLKEKNLDLIVANNILQEGAGFNVDTNQVLLVDQHSSLELPMQSKILTAEQIIQYILNSDSWKNKPNNSSL